MVGHLSKLKLINHFAVWNKSRGHVITPVPTWSNKTSLQVLYTLGHACSVVVSWGSENYVNQMARLTELELDVK